MSGGSGIDSLLGLLLGLISGLLALVEIPVSVSSSLGRELVSRELALLLSIVLGITISKLFCTSRRESTMGINSLFLGLFTSFRSSGYNYVLVINKLAELP